MCRRRMVRALNSKSLRHYGWNCRNLSKNPCTPGPWLLQISVVRFSVAAMCRRHMVRILNSKSLLHFGHNCRNLSKNQRKCNPVLQYRTSAIITIHNKKLPLCAAAVWCARSIQNLWGTMVQIAEICPKWFLATLILYCWKIDNNVAIIWYFLKIAYTTQTTG